MFYIIEDNIRIKKWENTQPLYVVEGKRKMFPLDRGEYEQLKACDGLTDLAPNDVLYRLEMMGIIRRCEKGEVSLKEDQIREYPNYFFRDIDWTITERCNFNCLHCFHAADNNRHKEEFSREEAFRLLREAKECGITGIRLTGGEPTLFPYIREVMQEMRNLEIPLDTLITNGYGLDEELIGFVRSLHPKAVIMLSFDGIGTHDWLRQHEGAEEQVKNTIRLCKKAGLYMKVNMNANRRNRDVIFDSTVMLAEMGVDEVRIIKTTEAPRWQLNAADDSLTIGEYYNLSAEFARQYREHGLALPVTIWQSLFLNGKKQTFSVLPVKASACNYHEEALICNAMTRKVSVQANGEIIPCAPLAGLYTLLGIKMGNIKTEGLKKTLTEGPLIENVIHTVGDKRTYSQKCGGCPYFENCQGGCPALSMLFSGSLLGPDDYKCAFYSGEYYNAFCNVLEGWKNLTPM